MGKLYKKSEIWFAVLWIIIYVVGMSYADEISRMIGIEKSISFVFAAAVSMILLVWVKKNDLMKKYGLCKTAEPASKFLFYLPLVVITSCNLWFGVILNLSIPETIFYMLSMLCVGFLEELIFRGFLFKAMSKDNVKSAMIVSSVTFGIGHIVNLFNGSGADLISNLCQIVSAVAFGFLFVIIFYRGKTLIPCIVTHSVLNALSAIANEGNRTEGQGIMVSVILTVIAVGYTLILTKTLPDAEEV